MPKSKGLLDESCLFLFFESRLRIFKLLKKCLQFVMQPLLESILMTRLWNLIFGGSEAIPTICLVKTQNWAKISKRNHSHRDCVNCGNRKLNPVSNSISLICHQVQDQMLICINVPSNSAELEQISLSRLIDTLVTLHPRQFYQLS